MIRPLTVNTNKRNKKTIGEEEERRDYRRRYRSITEDLHPSTSALPLAADSNFFPYYACKVL